MVDKKRWTEGRTTGDELVKSLRICAADGSCRTCPRFTICTDEEGPVLSGIMNDAADAIVGMKREIEYMVRAEKPHWIPVAERLPSENNHRYLTVSIEPWFGTTVVDIMRWIGVWMYDGRQTEAKVTYWMPLPEPPKEAHNEP